MPTLSHVDKPRRWGPIDPNDVLPEYRWAWDNAILLVPFWENGGDPFNYATNKLGSRVNGAWEASKNGMGWSTINTSGRCTFSNIKKPVGDVPMSCFLAFRAVGTVEPFPITFGVDASNTGDYNLQVDTPGVDDYSFGLNTSGAPAKSGVAWGNDGGGAYSFYTTIGIRRLVGGATDFVQDGKLVAAGVAGDATLANAKGQNIVIGARQTDQSGSDANYTAAYAWSDAKTVAQLRLLDRNPLGPFTLADDVIARAPDAVGGLSIPVAMYQYRRTRGKAA